MTEEKRKVGTKFTSVLAIISIIGFVNIILEAFVENFSLTKYFDAIWLFIIGMGFVISSKPKNLYEGSRKYISDVSFSRLTTLILGTITIIAAILTIPELNITHPALETVKAIISLIAIIFIAFQTWMMEH